VTFSPTLERAERRGIGVLSDPQSASAGVWVAFLDRCGGVSRGPYSSLNLAARVADDPDDVAANRARAASVLGFDICNLVLARQVHGAEVLEVTATSAGVVGEGDGLVAHASGPVLGLLTADCAPIVVAGAAGVAVLHGGWRGLVAGIVERGLEAVPGARWAWVGPAIRACCYRVGPEVVAAFRRRGLEVGGEGHIDVAAAAAAVLRRAGLEVAVSDVCTACDGSYYSYRRDGTTGRQGTFAARA
jgi:YfiH family protein